MRSAVATWVAGLIAMCVMISLAGAIAAGRVPRLLAKLTFVALATALATGGYFFIAFPGVPGAAIGQGTILFAIAVPLALVPAIRVLRA